MAVESWSRLPLEPKFSRQSGVQFRARQGSFRAGSQSRGFVRPPGGIQVLTEIPIMLSTHKDKRRDGTNAATLMVLLAITTSQSWGATISGTVRGEGKPGAEGDALCGKYDSRQF